jgi:ribosomal protein S18 acetylase RimI-like enzyme
VTDGARVRRAREAEIPALAPLLFMPAERMYERIAPDRRRALRLIEADLRGGMLDVTWVAEVDGAIAGAMVAYPYRDDVARARALLRVALRRSPPWRWPAIARVFLRGHRHNPRHPADSLYVDALAVLPEFRRRGVASALLEHAAQTAAMRGLSGVSLNTAETNAAAVALYRRCGFEVADVVPARPPVPALLAFHRPVERRGCS